MFVGLGLAADLADFLEGKKPLKLDLRDVNPLYSGSIEVKVSGRRKEVYHS